jgi:hypothetical protein
MPIQKAPPEFHAPGQGASVTPHDKTQLQMATQAPDPPDIGEKALVRTPEGLRAVVHHVRDNAGDFDRPDYRSTYYVHTRRGTEPHTQEGIRRLWKDVTDWTPEPRAWAYLKKAEHGIKSWSEALNTIALQFDRTSGSEVVNRG